jgi:hypothetical protein
VSPSRGKPQTSRSHATTVPQDPATSVHPHKRSVVCHGPAATGSQHGDICPHHDAAEAPAVCASEFGGDARRNTVTVTLFLLARTWLDSCGSAASSSREIETSVVCNRAGDTYARFRGTALDGDRAEEEAWANVPYMRTWLAVCGLPRAGSHRVAARGHLPRPRCRRNTRRLFIRTRATLAQINRVTVTVFLRLGRLPRKVLSVRAVERRRLSLASLV